MVRIRGMRKPPQGLLRFFMLGQLNTIHFEDIPNHIILFALNASSQSTFHQQRCTHIECSLAFLRKYGFMALSLCFFVKEPRPVRLAVILELERIAADEDFRWSHKSVQTLLIPVEKICICGVRRIARHDQQHGDRVGIAAWDICVVGQILEYEPLKQRAEGCGHFRKIVGRADDQAVCFPNGIQHRRQTITANAVTFVFFFLASKAGDASRIPFQTEQVKTLYDCASGFRTL